MSIYVRALVQRVGTPQDLDGVNGVACVQVGEPVRLLEAQAERGFANVPEKALEDLLLMKGKKVPDGDEDDIDRRTDLQMACIAAIKPDCTDVEAAAYVEKAFIIEHPDVNLDPLVSEQALSDVLNAGEAKKAAEYALAVKIAKAQKKLVRHTRKTNLHKYFKKSKAPKYSEKQKQPPRWLPKKQEKNTAAISQWIEEHKGPSTTIQCDDYNGRWRVIAANLQWRSISWTKRGFEKAALEVVHQSWVFHTDHTGHEAPFDLDALAHRYQDDVGID